MLTYFGTFEMLLPWMMFAIGNGRRGNAGYCVGFWESFRYQGKGRNMKLCVNGMVREKSSKVETWQGESGAKQYDVNLLEVFIPDGDGMGETVVFRVKGDLPLGLDRGVRVNVVVSELKMIKGIQHAFCEATGIQVLKGAK